MYMSFVDETIKEFEQKNNFIIAFFNIKKCNAERLDPNFYIGGYNLQHKKYIIGTMPCYFYSSYFDEKEPTYDYDSYITNYYESYEEFISCYINLLKFEIDYTIHNNTIDTSYKIFHYDRDRIYRGKINEPYLIFEKNDINRKEIIYSKILLTVSGYK